MNRQTYNPEDLDEIVEVFRKGIQGLVDNPQVSGKFFALRIFGNLVIDFTDEESLYVGFAIDPHGDFSVQSKQLG